MTCAIKVIFWSNLRCNYKGKRNSNHGTVLAVVSSHQCGWTQTNISVEANEPTRFTVCNPFYRRVLWAQSIFLIEKSSQIFMCSICCIPEKLFWASIHVRIFIQNHTWEYSKINPCRRFHANIVFCFVLGQTATNSINQNVDAVEKGITDWYNTNSSDEVCIYTHRIDLQIIIWHKAVWFVRVKKISMAVLTRTQRVWKDFVI